MFFLFFFSFIMPFSLLSMEFQLSDMVVKRFLADLRTMLVAKDQIPQPNNLVTIYQETDKKMWDILKSEPEKPDYIKLFKEKGLKKEIEIAEKLWVNLQEADDFNKKLPFLLMNILETSGVKYPSKPVNNPAYHKMFLLNNADVDTKSGPQIIAAAILLSKWALEIKPLLNPSTNK